VIIRTINHFRGHGVAYVALFFALGGGGVGAAIAATTSSTTIHACVSKKNGAVYIARRCTKTTTALTFNKRGPAGATGATGAAGPAGTPAVVAWASVSSNGNESANHGMTVAETSTGVYTMTVTASQCQGQGTEAPVVTPDGDPTASGTLSGIPVAWVGYTTSTGTPPTFTVTAGFIQNGSFVPGNEGFDVQDQCGA
jgi:hypothetical protein